MHPRCSQISHFLNLPVGVSLQVIELPTPEKSPGSLAKFARQRQRFRGFDTLVYFILRVHIPIIYSLLNGEQRSYLEFPNQMIVGVGLEYGDENNDHAMGL